MAVALKYLSYFWRSLEMLLINSKTELKLKWAKHCALSAASNDNDNHNNIIFTIKDIKLYVSVVTLSRRNNTKLSKLLSKGFERSVYWNEYKKKAKIKIQQMNIDMFLNQILL